MRHESYCYIYNNKTRGEGRKVANIHSQTYDEIKEADCDLVLARVDVVDSCQFTPRKCFSNLVPRMPYHHCQTSLLMTKKKSRSRKRVETTTNFNNALRRLFGSTQQAVVVAKHEPFVKIPAHMAPGTQLITDTHFLFSVTTTVCSKNVTHIRSHCSDRRQ